MTHKLLQELHRHGLYQPFLILLLGSNSEQELRDLCTRIQPCCQLTDVELDALCTWWHRQFNPQRDASQRHQELLHQFDQARFTPDAPHAPRSFDNRLYHRLMRHDTLQGIPGQRYRPHQETQLFFQDEQGKNRNTCHVLLNHIPMQLRMRVHLESRASENHLWIEYLFLTPFEKLSHMVVNRLLAVKPWNISHRSATLLSLVYWIDATTWTDVTRLIPSQTGELTLSENQFHELIERLQQSGVDASIHTPSRA